MVDRELSKIYDFLKEINKFKQVERLSLVSEGGRRESDAEHTWHLVMWVWLFSDFYEKEIDLLKSIKMALVHDLVEIYAGDVYGGAIEEVRKGKEEREKESALKLFSQLPEKIGSEFMELWKEYEAKETNEAQLVWALDKISPRFQLTITKKDAAFGMPSDDEKKKAQIQRIGEISPNLKAVLGRIYEERTN